MSFLLVVLHGFANPSVNVLKDVAYGPDEKQKMDVYSPMQPQGAPVIFMVHGGAWVGGDKANKAEFEQKVAHWVSKGFVFVSTNYRTLPELRPYEQTLDIEAALSFAQKNARDWGGSSDKFIVMGHSSGAHLVSLLSSRYDSVISNGIKPWLATISLDISGYNIIKKVTGPNASEFYLEKFGSSPEYLKKASPYHVLSNKIPAFLAVCSSRSADACEQAEDFLAKAKGFGTPVQLLPVDLSHGEINSELGAVNCYTRDVDDFIRGLNSEFKSTYLPQERVEAACDASAAAAQ